MGTIHERISHSPANGVPPQQLTEPWFGRTMRWATASWSLSALLNMCVVIALGLYVIPSRIVEQVRELIATAPEARSAELVSVLVEQEIVPAENPVRTSTALAGARWRPRSPRSPGFPVGDDRRAENEPTSCRLAKRSAD